MQIMNRPKEAIVVESFISGVKKPFLAHREVTVIGDDCWETYEEISGAKCPTPWDSCCIDRKRIARTMISIIDHSGTLLNGTREGVGGNRGKEKTKGSRSSEQRINFTISQPKHSENSGS